MRGSKIIGYILCAPYTMKCTETMTKMHGNADKNALMQSKFWLRRKGAALPMPCMGQNWDVAAIYKEFVVVLVFQKFFMVQLSSEGWQRCFAGWNWALVLVWLAVGFPTWSRRGWGGWWQCSSCGAFGVRWSWGKDVRHHVVGPEARKAQNKVLIQSEHFFVQHLGFV